MTNTWLCHYYIFVNWVWCNLSTTRASVEATILCLMAYSIFFICGTIWCYVSFRTDATPHWYFMTFMPKLFWEVSFATSFHHPLLPRSYDKERDLMFLGTEIRFLNWSVWTRIQSALRNIENLAICEQRFHSRHHELFVLTLDYFDCVEILFLCPLHIFR